MVNLKIMNTDPAPDLTKDHQTAAITITHQDGSPPSNSIVEGGNQVVLAVHENQSISIAQTTIPGVRP